MRTKDVEKLLEEFRQIPKKEKNGKTFLEIARCPHYENVWSNILAFYLNPNAEHGFGDMLLRTFMQLIGIDNKEYNPETVKIDREYRTANNNRLDIVIETDTFVLGIENKVRSGLNNDLFDYSGTIENLAKGKQTYKIVLSKYKCRCDDGFVNVLYNDLIKQVVNASIEIKTKNKYQTLFQDFLETIDNEINYNPMNHNPELVKFFTENHVEIAELLEYSNWMKNFIFKKLESIHESLRDIFSRLIGGGNFNSDFYEKDDSFRSYFFFKVNGYSLCCETSIKIGDAKYGNWIYFYPGNVSQVLEGKVYSVQDEEIVGEIEKRIQQVINELSI